MGLWRRLAGDDTTARAGLPVHELLAPLPVIAIALLVLNDRVLKGSAAPEWLTGKLSDVTGVFVFPLAAVAVVDLVGAGLARLGVGLDYTLRRWKLGVAIGFTALVFGAMKLSPAIGGWVERAWSWLIPSATIYPDPTDAFALIVLAGTWWHGRRAIARGAYGRLAVARARHAAGRPLASPFGDAVACGADPARVRELDAAVARWLAGGDAAPVDAALSRLR
ncbi:MAG: hypothetical protein H0V17_14435 [Deltaproteobacteria bacterium]|nr:hypothetical protein [Deltaproteobacteria bacterium]